MNAITKLFICALVFVLVAIIVVAGPTRLTNLEVTGWTNFSNSSQDVLVAGNLNVTGTVNTGSGTFITSPLTADLDAGGFDIFNATILNGTTITDGTLSISSGDITDVGVINATGIVQAGVYASGGVVAGEDDAVIGDSTFGMLRIGASQIAHVGDATVGGLALNGSMLFRNSDGANPINFLFATADNLVRFAIPIAGVDYATYNPRSFIIGGDLNQTFDDGIINCSAQGYTQIDCDTSSTGADLGIQDDVEVRGAIFALTNVTTEKIIMEVDTANHFIYDNATCIIIEGDTSTLNIC